LREGDDYLIMFVKRRKWCWRVYCPPLRGRGENFIDIG